MFKRIRWVALGAVAGASGSLWAQRRVRARVERLAPDHVARRAVGSARSAGRQLRGAVTDGRDAMHAREHELRRAYGLPESNLGGSTPEKRVESS